MVVLMLKGMVFSMLGTLMAIKGHGYRLASLCPMPAASRKPLGLLIAGEGPERQNLESLANSLGLEIPWPFWAGKNPREWKRFIWPQISCSIRPEWIPSRVVILEAMNWSKVVIGSDVVRQCRRPDYPRRQRLFLPLGRCGRTHQNHAGPGEPPGEAPGDRRPGPENRRSLAGGAGR